ncbi:MAG: phosphoribosylanthranilate isomerase [Pseudomonadota bacterium]|nr:phosphoribosylanthranilate isomerase [Pseudomonadota bacterium]
MSGRTRTRIKICGITRVEDGAAAIAAGADALGMIFWEPSARHVPLEAAGRICALPGPFCARVGVFVDPEPVFLRSLLDHARLTCLQFHGNEGADYCRSFGLPYIKALRMRDGVDLDRAVRDYGDACGLLLDSYVPEQPGGTGKTFAWDRACYAEPGDSSAKPILLAGGLTAENVATAIAAAKPYGVDVSGGVEDAPGIKNPRRIEAFCAAVRAADRRL